MPLPIAALVAGASLLGSAGGIWSQNKTNRQSREWNEAMYERQRRDALSDWEMQNVYNSPAAQMQRLKDAGLNPNLVYGHGADATASSLPQKASVEGWNPHSPIQGSELSSAVQGGLSAYYDTQIREAQLDNLKAQNVVMQQDALVKASDVVGKNITQESQRFDLQMKQTLKDTSLEYARENLKGKMIHNQFQLSENERREALTASSLSQSVERVLLMRAQRSNIPAERSRIFAQIDNIKADTELKKLDRQYGRNSPWYVKAVDQLVENPDVKQAIDYIETNLIGGDDSMKFWDRVIGNYNKKPW